MTYRIHCLFLYANRLSQPDIKSLCLPNFTPQNSNQTKVQCGPWRLMTEEAYFLYERFIVGLPEFTKLPKVEDLNDVENDNDDVNDNEPSADGANGDKLDSISLEFYHISQIEKLNLTNEEFKKLYGMDPKRNIYPSLKGPRKSQFTKKMTISEIDALFFKFEQSLATGARAHVPFLSKIIQSLQTF